jgi:cytochrome c oxidase subunit 4
MSQQTEAVEQRTSSGEAHTGHPTPATYLKVAIVLSTITAIEVAIFYATWLGHGIIPVLVVLSGAKFSIVAMFYMHLKYDARLFTNFFISGLLLAMAIVIAIMALFRYFA